MRLFHLVADYHGQLEDQFIMDLIFETNQVFVKAGCREEITLIGSGGIIAAEHVAKATILGLDAIALDTPLLVALQAQFVGNCRERVTSQFIIAKDLPLEWGRQRIQNFISAWRDQLLELMGAMGIRELRRLRGELGRAMFQKELEDEAFKGIQGYG